MRYRMHRCLPLLTKQSPEELQKKEQPEKIYKKNLQH